MHSRSPGDLPRLNADAPWDEFDPLDYVSHNYRSVLPVDAEIISVVRGHFSDHFSRRTDLPARGIDVGAGANLYPAFTLLPWCEEITLLDRSKRNVRYLQEQRQHYDRSWDAFWDLLRQDEAYAALGGDQRARFSQVVQVERGDLFDLGSRRGHWNVGTMFFVAESLSTSRAEFWRSVECFMGALEPGSPFAAAFMEHSLGYEVAKRKFPACDVSESQVYASLERYAEKLETFPLGGPNEVREGYSSMIVACGLRGTGTS